MFSLDFRVSDSPNSRVTSTDLHNEIVALSLGSAVFQELKILGDAKTGASVLRVVFDVEPDTADKNTLAAAIAAHQGTAPIQGTRIVTRDGKTIEATGFASGQPVWEEIT